MVTEAEETAEALPDCASCICELLTFLPHVFFD